MGLETLVSRITFHTERITPHILPGAFLGLGLAALSSYVYSVLIMGGGANQWYQPLIGLYIAYVLAASYSSYRLLKHAHRHLVDSGILSYYRARLAGDREAIVKLYRGGLLRKDIPSPVTGLVLGIVSLGVAYPVILYIVEKNLRMHIVGEESTFLYQQPSVRVIGVENLLLDLAATMLTMGFYMIYWGLRVVKVYNGHIARMHGASAKHAVEVPQPPRLPAESSPIFILFGALLAGVGLTGFLGLAGIKAHLLLSLGMGFAAAYYSVRLSHGGVGRHVFGLLGLVYLLFIMGSIAGLLAYPGYLDFYESLRESLSSFLSHDPLVLARNIFTNNIVIGSAELVPIIGLLYLGVGIGNSSVYYGVYLAQNVFEKGDYSPLLLFILPHTFLELLAYSIMAAASTRLILDREIKGVVLAISGILTLFTAALVEAYTIILSGGI